MKNLVDNKKFWKTVKCFCSNKSSNFENNSLKTAICLPIIVKLRKCVTNIFKT